MIPEKYLKRLKKIVRKHFPEAKNKVFIFGSSIKSDSFWDIDVGILDPVKKESIRALSEELEKSTFPFIVDLVDFNTVGPDFYESVIHNQEKQWI